MNNRIATLFALSVSVLVSPAAAFAAPAAGTGPDPARLLVGAWQWTYKKNNCTETYIYGADGTLSVTSGEEETKQTYTVDPNPEGRGRYKVSKKIVEDFGGRDCADSDEDNTGQTATVYVQFNKTGKMMIECFSADGNDCIGPLRKIGN